MGPWPSSPIAFASALYPGRCLAFASVLTPEGAWRLSWQIPGIHRGLPKERSRWIRDQAKLPCLSVYGASRHLLQVATPWWPVQPPPPPLPPAPLLLPLPLPPPGNFTSRCFFFFSFCRRQRRCQPATASGGASAARVLIQGAATAKPTRPRQTAGAKSPCVTSQSPHPETNLP